jgi:N6-adenosine-specific RNA methylase IME4
MMQFHPLAEIFPLMEGQEFDDLVADIKAHGLREPIVTYGNKILDGRNRYRACVAAGIPCWSNTYKGKDPIAFVISLNLKRRHLNESQRAMAAARLANLPPGRRPRGKPADLRVSGLASNEQQKTDATIVADVKAWPDGGISQDHAAKVLNVSPRSIQQAAHVQRNGTEEIKSAVDRGKLTVTAAAQAAKLDVETQRKVATQAEAGDAHAARNVIKKEARAVRERELGEKQIKEPTGLYGVIVTDCEWQFETWSEKGKDRAADNHYPTTPTLELIEQRAAMMRKIAAKDCVLYAWATVPMLLQALQFMVACGFEYKSHQVWIKDQIGTGYWFRNAHELLLVGTKGNIPAPAPGTQFASAIQAPVGEHSAKPELFLEQIEKYFPTLPKIELNRRGLPRQGWSAWGNQASRDDEPCTTKISDLGVESPAFNSLDIPNDLSIPTGLRRSTSAAPQTISYAGRSR